MSYPLWKRLGLNQILFDELSKTTEFFQYLASIKTSDDLNFKNLPLTMVYSELGDGKSADTYQFMIDYLVIKGSPDMIFPNVTVRLIDAEKSFFVIGMNIIKYLSIRYRPNIKDQIFEIALEREGYDLYLADQQSGLNNELKVHFQLMDSSEEKIDSIHYDKLSESDIKNLLFIQMTGKLEYNKDVSQWFAEKALPLNDEQLKALLERKYITKTATGYNLTQKGKDFTLQQF